MQINGVELKFDLYDTETIKKYDMAIEATAKASDELIKNENEGKINNYQVLSGMIDAVHKAFDEIFGAGTAEKIFGREKNLLKTTEAYETLITEANNQQSAYADAIAKLTKAQSLSKTLIKPNKPQIVLLDAPAQTVGPTSGISPDTVQSIVEKAFANENSN